MVKFGQLFLSLTILITLHEFGHFWFARRFKTRVDKFYLFFDFLFPFAGVLNFPLFKKKIGDTEYGLGWFPFGGYVSIAGMVDEQMDKDQIATEPQPWELRSKPAWQRMLVMLGGIIVNLILGFFIFWMLNWAVGKEKIVIKDLPYGIAYDSLALKMGFQQGDFIKSIEGKEITSLNRVTITIIMERAKSVQVIRNGKEVDIPVNSDDIGLMLKRIKKSDFVSARIPCVIDSLIPDSAAIKSGLKVGDKLIAFNGIPTRYFNEFKYNVSQNKGKKVYVQCIRGNDTLVKTVEVSKSGNIGFYPRQKGYIKPQSESFTFFGAFAQSAYDCYEAIVMQAKQLIVIFTVKDATSQVGGFYTMYQNMNPVWDWVAFWKFTGFLSLVLAFMNFLPIPMLDGGYVLFILVEMITRRKVPEKFIYYANYVGLFLILGLMIWANTDWLRN